MRRSATMRALEDTTRIMLRYVLPVLGAWFIIASLVAMAGGPCLMGENSITCSFGERRSL